MSCDELFYVSQQGVNVAKGHDVIALGVFNISGTRNLLCEIATCLDWNQGVSRPVKDQCWHSYRRQYGPDVYGRIQERERFKCPWTCGQPFKFGKSTHPLRIMCLTWIDQIDQLA